jgi:hypothetical protein
MSDPVIVTDGVISAAEAKAETFKGRADLGEIAASALGRYVTLRGQVKHFRDGQMRAPSLVDAQGAEKLTQELRSAQRAATDAAIEYVAACIARGEQVQAVRKRLIERI